MSVTGLLALHQKVRGDHPNGRSRVALGMSSAELNPRASNGAPCKTGSKDKGPFHTAQGCSSRKPKSVAPVLQEGPLELGV